MKRSTFQGSDHRRGRGSVGRWANLVGAFEILTSSLRSRAHPALAQARGMGNTTCCDADSDQSKDVQMKEIATSLVDSAAGLSPPLSTRDAKVTQKYVEAPTAKNNG